MSATATKADTINTVIHTYRFNIDKPNEKIAWENLCEQLKAQGLQVMAFYGGGPRKPGAVDTTSEGLNGRTVALELTHLFKDQWNTGPVEGVSDKGLRVFDWFEVIYDNRRIKTGHYLEQTAEMKEARRNTHKCGYCGHQERAERGSVFCPRCIDSEYLKETDLLLTRMRPVEDSHKPFPPLTDAERAHLLPLFRDAQIHGATEQGKARIAKARADIAAKRAKALLDAETEYAGMMWVLGNVPGLLKNVIFYNHTRRFEFGWSKPLGAAELSALLDVISEFPASYDIKTEDGRTLSGD